MTPPPQAFTLPRPLRCPGTARSSFICNRYKTDRAYFAAGDTSVGFTPSPAFPVSRVLERKGSWQRSSLTCRAAERATRAASQFYALRPRTALLHTSPHPPEHELRRDAG